MIAWREDYSVKFEGIDVQHKTLISIMQEVEKELASKTEHFKNLIEIVNKLDNYIKEHLSYEEAMMKKYGYPDAEKHGSEHNELRYKILSINYDDIGNVSEFYQNTYTYLSNWLINHIMETDKALGGFLASKAV